MGARDPVSKPWTKTAGRCNGSASLILEVSVRDMRPASDSSAPRKLP